MQDSVNGSNLSGFTFWSVTTAASFSSCSVACRCSCFNPHLLQRPTIWWLTCSGCSMWHYTQNWGNPGVYILKGQKAFLEKACFSLRCPALARPWPFLEFTLVSGFVVEFFWTDTTDPIHTFLMSLRHFINSKGALKDLWIAGAANESMITQCHSITAAIFPNDDNWSCYSRLG